MKQPNKPFILGFLSCFLLMSSFLLFGFTESKSKIFSTGLVSSGISWNTALAMKNKYLSSSPLKIEVNNGGGNTLVPLEGFTIQADHLLEIIQANKVGVDASDVVFFLGAEDPAPGFSAIRYNLIAVGKNANGLMVPANDRDKSDPTKSSIFDKAEPCPPFCPE